MAEKKDYVRTASVRVPLSTIYGAVEITIHPDCPHPGWVEVEKDVVKIEKTSLDGRVVSVESNRRIPQADKIHCVGSIEGGMWPFPKLGKPCMECPLKLRRGIEVKIADVSW